MPTAQTTAISSLISTLLGYSLGQEILADLIGPDEQVSPRNLRDRLRVAICSGSLSRLTPKRLAKLQAALELGRQLYVEETPLGEVVDTPEHAVAVFNCIAWEPREIFAIAMKAGATRLIVGHNHPSSDTQPSKADLELTEMLLAAAKVMSIPILDHLVVGYGASTSIRATTDLWKE